MSDYDRTLALEQRIAPADKITSIHNGVHDGMVDSQPITAAVGARIVMVGGAPPQKDHAGLLHALADCASWTGRWIWSGLGRCKRKRKR